MKMKRLLLLSVLSIVSFTVINSQISEKFRGSINSERIKSHLEEVNLKHSDSTYIYSAIPEKANLTQSKNSEDLHFPYPVIFIHGLTGSADTWIEFYNYALNQNWSYGGQIKFNLNSDDNLYYSNIYSNQSDVTDFNWNLDPADFYLVNFNCSVTGEPYGGDYNTSTQSNQAAIAKQGLAIREAISHVLQATGRNKVILFGHSMGGLAAREYMQNPDLWQLDGEHHIAKIITSGTPHGGSNATGTFFLDALSDIDEKSDAVRDLRRSYFYSQNNGVFLYGGTENEVILNDNLSGFYDLDVNCNGVIGNQITGLNLKDIYIDLDYSNIIGNWLYDISLSNLGDGVVEVEDAQIKNFYNIISETFIINSNSFAILHTELPDFVKWNFYALDEPDYYDLSLEIDVNTNYNGFITEQANDAEYSIDYDDFVFSTDELGFISVSLENISSYPFGMSILKKQTLEIVFDQTYQSGQLETERILLPKGDYYLEFYANGNENSWKYPYFFRLNWLRGNTTSLGGITEEVEISVTPNPVTSNLKLQVEGLDNSGFEFNITNQMGQLVYSDIFEENKVEKRIDFSLYPSGIYFLSLNTNKGVVTRKIIKQ